MDPKIVELLRRYRQGDMSAFLELAQMAKETGDQGLLDLLGVFVTDADMESRDREVGQSNERMARRGARRDSMQSAEQTQMADPIQMILDLAQELIGSGPSVADAAPPSRSTVGLHGREATTAMSNPNLMASLLSAVAMPSDAGPAAPPTATPAGFDQELEQLLGAWNRHGDQTRWLTDMFHILQAPKMFDMLKAKERGMGSAIENFLNGQVPVR